MILVALCAYCFGRPVLLQGLLLPSSIETVQAAFGTLHFAVIWYLASWSLRGANVLGG